MNWAKFKLWIEFYWIYVVFSFIVLAAVFLPLWYLTRLEESVARYIIGFNVISLPSSIMGTLIFVFFLYIFLHGGLADNMIPEQAVLRVSYRPRPNQDPLAFLERVRKAVDEILLGPMKREARTGQLDIDLQYQGPGLLTEADTILEKALLSAGALGPAGAAPYSTDGGHLAGAGLRCLICGPGSLAQAHRADESISSAAFEQGVPFLRAVIREYCLTKRN